MKKLILFLALIPVLAIGQNRFEKRFAEADSAYLATIKKAVIESAEKADSASFKAFYSSCYEIWVTAQKEKTLKMSEEDFLSEYMTAYILGQLSYDEHKEFNYELLEKYLIKVKKNIRKYKMYQ